MKAELRTELKTELKTEYYLEIYEPNDRSTVAGFYESATPFMALHIGDAIHSASLNGAASRRQHVRIKDIQHIFWEIAGSHRTHKICVFTELAL